MDLPFCKICGERHRLGHCPEWDEPPPIPPRKLEPKPVLKVVHAPKAVSAAKAVEHHQAQEAEKEAPPQVRPKFDKRAYQRDLMRKRRAALKASPHPQLP